MTTTIAKARRLIEAADQASARPWDAANIGGGFPNAVVSRLGDAELGNWIVCPNVRWPTDRAYIIAARNDAPDIARALVEAVEIVREMLKTPAEIGHVGDWYKHVYAAKNAARAFLAEHDGERG